MSQIDLANSGKGHYEALPRRGLNAVWYIEAIHLDDLFETTPACAALDSDFCSRQTTLSP